MRLLGGNCLTAVCRDKTTSDGVFGTLNEHEGKVDFAWFEAGIIQGIPGGWFVTSVWEEKTEDEHPKSIGVVVANS